MSRKLILFLVSCGLLLLLLGAALLFLYSLYQQDCQHIRPFIVVGQKFLSFLQHFYEFYVFVCRPCADRGWPHDHHVLCGDLCEAVQEQEEGAGP